MHQLARSRPGDTNQPSRRAAGRRTDRDDGVVIRQRHAAPGSANGRLEPAVVLVLPILLLRLAVLLLLLFEHLRKPITQAARLGRLLGEQRAVLFLTLDVPLDDQAVDDAGANPVS